MITMPKMLRSSRSGISLLELAIVVSIGTMLSLAMSALFRSMGKATKNAEESMIQMSEEALGNRQLWFDLRQAGVSFNFLSIGLCGKPPNSPDFFDYLSEAVCRPPAGADPENNPCTRKHVLELKNDGSESEPMVLALSQGGLAPPTPLSPLTFYTVAPALDFTTPGSLTFRLMSAGADQPGLIDVLNGMISSQLHDGANVLRFYSPITMRTTASLGNPLVPSRQVSLVATASVTDSSGTPVITAMDTAPPPWIQCQRHPSLEVDLASGSTSDALDRFFRLVPPVGGRSAFGMVMPLEIVRYRLVPIIVGKQVTGQLLREKYEAETRTWSSTHAAATGVKSVEFLRKNVSIPSIKASMVMDKQKK